IDRVGGSGEPLAERAVHVDVTQLEQRHGVAVGDAQSAQVLCDGWTNAGLQGLGALLVSRLGVAALDVLVTEHRVNTRPADYVAEAPKYVDMGGKLASLIKQRKSRISAIFGWDHWQHETEAWTQSLSELVKRRTREGLTDLQFAKEAQPLFNNLARRRS